MDELTIEKIEKIADITHDYQNAVYAVSHSTNVTEDWNHVHIFADGNGGVDHIRTMFENAGYPTSIDERIIDGECWVYLNSAIRGVKFVSCERKRENDET